MQERPKLQSPYKDGGEGFSMAPLPHIEGLSEDLQMLGQYLLLQINNCAKSAEFARKRKEAAEINPIDVELDSEEEAKEAGLNKKDAAFTKELALDIEGMESEINDYEEYIVKVQAILEELKNHQYDNCMNFLKLALEASEHAEQITTKFLKRNQKGTTNYQAKEESRRGALREYISILGSKLSV